jgi:hypothetical protein
MIKVTSTVSSKASAAGLMTYLGTREVERENGEKGKTDIPIFDQDGIAIASREERAAVLQAWVSEFREPYAVDAVATLSVTLTGTVGDDELHDALNKAFGTKPFLYARHPDGKVSIYAVTDLPAKKIAGALGAREKGEGTARTIEKAEADIAQRLSDAGVPARVQIIGAAVSEKSGRYYMEKFLRTENNVSTSAGDKVKREPTVKEAADRIWQGWSADVRTVEPRNAFHVIFSARAGTDPEAMKRAVRDFLSEQVAGHRWITAHHPETGHVHVHAMISSRDDVGKALRLTKPDLYEWRERFAAKARSHGIAMVATRRADVAATRPYSQAQAGAYERGRTNPRYLKTPSVTQRVERKRAGVVDRASLTDGNLALAAKWQATSTALKQVGAKPSVVEAAERFAVAAGRAKGYVIFKLVADEKEDREAIIAAIQSALGVDRQAIFVSANSAHVLASTTASVSKTERELARQNDEFGPGGEMQVAVRQVTRRLKARGLQATVTIEAAGSAKNGSPSPWLRKRFETLTRSGQGPSPVAKIQAFISNLKQQKGKVMPLSLEQFDERVARANKSMERLETMVDSGGERQAVEEMRREISALFAEQRRDIELQQMPSAMTAGEGGGTGSGAQSEGAAATARGAPPMPDPAIASQQQAIAAGRAARIVREQAGAAKSAEEQQRRQVSSRAEDERQRDGKDGAER